MELPTLKPLHEKLGKKGLKIIAINVDEPSTKMSSIKDYWSTLELPFDPYFDMRKEMMDKFKVNVLPANFVLDKEGKVAFVANGANDWSHPRSVQLIEDLL